MRWAVKIVLKEKERKRYGALCKLRDYERIGLSPDEVGRIDSLSDWEKYKQFKKQK